MSTAVGGFCGIFVIFNRFVVFVFVWMTGEFLDMITDDFYGHFTDDR
jgi:hypothetical protein